MKIKELAEDSRPRERLVKYGVKNLSDAELLALIFGSGPRGKKGEKSENAIEMANRLINHYGIDKLSECSLKELQEIKGIGFAKACQILALFEFNKRHSMAKKLIKKISSAKDVFDLFKGKLQDEKKENFIALHLDNKYNITKEEVISIGILDSSLIHPREVFKGAIKESAYAIILVHNHPSGDSTPSQKDIEVTRELMKAAEILDIKLLDHVIIGNKEYFSFKEKAEGMK
jgi:DNA repair protein RadC